MKHRKPQYFKRNKQTVCVTCHAHHPLDISNFPHSSAKTVRCALTGSVAASGSYSYSIPASLSRFCRWLSRRSARSCRAACNLVNASGCAQALEPLKQRRFCGWLLCCNGCACSDDSTSSCGHQVCLCETTHVAKIVTAGKERAGAHKSTHRRTQALLGRMGAVTRATVSACHKWERTLMSCTMRLNMPAGNRTGREIHTERCGAPAARVCVRRCGAPPRSCAKARAQTSDWRPSTAPGALPWSARPSPPASALGKQPVKLTVLSASSVRA